MEGAEAIRELPGSYTISVTGTSGRLTKTATLALTVNS